MSADQPWDELAARAGNERLQLLDRRATRRVELPLRLLRQQAHFTAPASELDKAMKAAGGALRPARRMLDRLGITAEDVGNRLGIGAASVRALLEGDGRSPLVLIDGEDAQALREDTVMRGRENAAHAFREAEWGNSLRFYRPSGLELDYCVGDLLEVLTRAGEGLPPERYPIDGVMWPKVEHPDELRWLNDLLGEVERRLGLPEHRLRLQFLVESASGLVHLPELARAALPRLCGIIFGIADFAADLELAEVRNDHPVADFARMQLATVAAAAGVPAIDAMSFRYPVADPALDTKANRQRVLTRIHECFEDTRHAIELGFSGKWVGHPLQLLACLLAFENALPKERIEEEIRRIEAYRDAVDRERGATIIAGDMADRATDRQARALLRKAVAWGALDRQRASTLGLVDSDELEEA